MARFQGKEEKKFLIWPKVFVVFVVELSAKLENPLKKDFAMPIGIAELKNGASEDCGSLE
jgi:hypothetical protein